MKVSILSVSGTLLAAPHAVCSHLIFQRHAITVLPETCYIPIVFGKMALEVLHTFQERKGDWWRVKKQMQVLTANSIRGATASPAGLCALAEQTHTCLFLWLSRRPTADFTRRGTCVLLTRQLHPSGAMHSESTLGAQQIFTEKSTASGPGGGFCLAPLPHPQESELLLRRAGLEPQNS